MNDDFVYEAEAREMRMRQREKQTSVKFLEWTAKEGWEQYDGYDRWINIQEGKKVLSTEQLFELFANGK